MTETVTVNEGGKAKRGRKKQGEAPFVVTYVNAEGNEEVRVPSTVSYVRLKANGSDVDVDVSQFPENTLKMLAAFALSKRIEATVRKSQDVIKDANDYIELLRQGKFYTRTAKEGSGKRGRSFDIELWVEAMERTLRVKVKHDMARAKKEGRAPRMTEEQVPQFLEQFKAKLEAAEGKNRNAITTKLMADQVFKVQMLALKTERAKNEAKNADASLDFLDGF